MLHRGVRGHQIKLAIADTPVILAPSHFIRIGAKVGTGERDVCQSRRAAGG